MNPAAVLALISDLYTQVSSLQAEVERLQAHSEKLGVESERLRAELGKHSPRECEPVPG